MKITIPDVVERFERYKNVPGNGAWGSLHTVLDDGNISDDSVWFCFDYAMDKGDTEGANLAIILLSMSKTQRIKINGVICNRERSRQTATSYQ